MLSDSEEHDCAHCVVDPHSSYPPRKSVLQLRGVWLCGYHLDEAVTIGGYLLGPETAREYLYVEQS